MSHQQQNKAGRSPRVKTNRRNTRIRLRDWQNRVLNQQLKDTVLERPNRPHTN